MNPNTAEFKRRIVEKYPNGVSSDGIRYADMDAVELTRRMVEKYPNGVTSDGWQYKAFLMGDKFQPDLSEYKKMVSADTESAKQNKALFPAEASDTVAQSGLKSLGNVPSSTVSLVSSIVGALANPIDTGRGIFDIVKSGGAKLAQTIDKTVTGEAIDTKETQTYDTVAKYLESRYGSVDNLKRTAVNDPMGLGSDILGVISGGAGMAGKLGKVAGGIEAVASPVTKTAEKIGGAISDTTKGAVTSAASGLSGESKIGLTKTLEASPEFKTGYKGDIDERGIVEMTRSGVPAVREARKTQYQDELRALAQKSSEQFDLAPVMNKLNQQLESFGIKRTDEGLDFTRSTLVGDEVTRLERAINVIEDWGVQEGDLNLIGIDTLKQKINLFANADPKLGALLGPVAKETKNLLAKSSVKDDYLTMEKNYAEKSKFIDELERTLSLDTDRTVDQTMTRLNSLLNEDRTYRRLLAEELKEITGKDVVAQIAGLNARDATLLPRSGAGKALTAGVAGATIFGAAQGFIPLLPVIVPLMALSSPKLLVKMLYTIGVSKNAVGSIISYVNEFRFLNGLKGINAAQIEKLLEDIKNTPNKNGGMVGGTRAIDEATKAELVDAIDYLRIGKQAPGIEETVSLLAQKYGISEDIGSAKLADKFQELVENTKTMERLPGTKLEPSLLQEAKKYKSAEEFVKAQPNQFKDSKIQETLYHGTHEDFKGFDSNFDYENIPDNIGQIRDYEVPQGVVFLSDSIERTKSYGGKTIPVDVKAKKVLVVDAGGKSPDRFFDDDYNGSQKIWGKFESGGYDAIKITGETPRNGKTSTYITYPENLKDKSQLTDIWKQAQASNPN